MRIRIFAHVHSSTSHHVTQKYFYRTDGRGTRIAIRRKQKKTGRTHSLIRSFTLSHQHIRYTLFLSLLHPCRRLPHTYYARCLSSISHASPWCMHTPGVAAYTYGTCANEITRRFRMASHPFKDGTCQRLPLPQRLDFRRGCVYSNHFPWHRV